MCVIFNAKEIVTIGATTMAPVVPSSTGTSFTTLLQVLKPKLPRKLTSTPKINLNKYWNLFEDCLNDANEVSFSFARDCNTNGCTTLREMEINNEINENISNEKEEIGCQRKNGDGEPSSHQLTTQCKCDLCLTACVQNISLYKTEKKIS